MSQARNTASSAILAATILLAQPALAAQVAAKAPALDPWRSQLSLKNKHYKRMVKALPQASVENRGHAEASRARALVERANDPDLVLLELTRSKSPASGESPASAFLEARPAKDAPAKLLAVFPPASNEILHPASGGKLSRASAKEWRWEGTTRSMVRAEGEKPILGAELAGEAGGSPIFAISPVESAPVLVKIDSVTGESSVVARLASTVPGQDTMRGALTRNLVRVSTADGARSILFAKSFLSAGTTDPNRARFALAAWDVTQPERPRMLETSEIRELEIDWNQLAGRLN